MVLHSEEEKAIEWPDGYGEYYLYGVHFDEKLWKKVTRKNVTPKTILTIENVEQRRAAILTVGMDKIVDEVAEPIAKSQRGNELLKIAKGKITEEELYLVRFTCPSTGRVYVHFTVANADELDISQLSPIQQELFNANWKGKPVAATKDPDHCVAFRFLWTPEEYNLLTIER